MKTKLLLLTLLIMQAITGYSQNNKDVSGQWKGIIHVQGTQLRIAFNITKTGNGYSSTTDSPDQGVTGMHCDSITVTADSIIIEVIAGAFFKGLLVNDSAINGTLLQSGMKIPLLLKKYKLSKNDQAPEINVDSNCVETKITLETKTGRLFGTLCTPKKFVSGPVALIIAGSGPTDRNGNSSLGLSTDAYKILAHKLSDENIATVRFDKRGIGESGLDMKSESDITFDDFIDDAIAWCKMLKSDKRFTKVIIIGHSEGSLIGMVAAKNGNADKYISIAGAGESLDETLKRQLESLPNEEKESAYKIIDSLDAGKKVNHVDTGFYALFRPSVQPFLISLFKYDPKTEVTKLAIPVLIIQGTNDIQITVDDAKALHNADKNSALNN
jgi:pimeloyl-ACP methyl ester carboxylesterase